MAKRSTDTGLPRNQSPTGKDRLPDPENSGQFDPALTPDVWAGCPVVKHDLGGRYVCDRAQPHPEDGIHSWVSDDPYDEADVIGRDTTGSLPAVPPSDVQAADPPATPDASGETPEPTDADHRRADRAAAGSGGRAGRPSTIGAAVGMVRAAKEYDDTAGKVAETFHPVVRPDARESVLAALGGVYNPAAEPGYAIRLAEDFARLMVMGPHFARLVQANADKLPPDPADVRVLYRKLRQIAATHGIDLDGADQ